MLVLAERVAREAGALLLQRGDLSSSTKTSPTDLVTAMDRAAERLIVTALRAARPGDGVLGEEGSDDPGVTGVRWVIDPIDGTTNYVYDLPDYAVSIAAEVSGLVEVGVVFNPARDELYAARRGRGATLGGQPLRCSRQSSLAEALVATGFGYEAPRRTRQAAILTSVLPAVRDIRRRGAASLDLCAVATGRVDAYYERGLMPWDLAAGGLIATEAGGRVEGLRGRPAGYDLVVAAPPALFPALHDLLAPLEPDRD